MLYVNGRVYGLLFDPLFKVGQPLWQFHNGHAKELSSRLAIVLAKSLRVVEDNGFVGKDDCLGETS